ncbi:MAG: carotenoid biosynthesis protein [Deltaproteobacteria bacterium]|nr:carotenoid biosynthesis protein [Deltaproteobacteria bacterium]
MHGLYGCIWIADFFRREFPVFAATPMRSALLTTAVALSLDLQLDPLASLSGLFWRWNDALPEWFLSVPLVNYVAWFSAFTPFGYAYWALHDRLDLSESMRLGKLLTRIPNVVVTAGILFFGLMFVFECGFGGPTYRILGDFFTKILPY